MFPPSSSSDPCGRACDSRKHGCEVGLGSRPHLVGRDVEGDPERKDQMGLERKLMKGHGILCEVYKHSKVERKDPLQGKLQHDQLVTFLSGCSEQ